MVTVVRPRGLLTVRSVLNPSGASADIQPQMASCCWRWDLFLTIACMLGAIQRCCGEACFPAVFAFGDSSADVGTMQAAFPRSTAGAGERFPYGSTFFKKPANRMSDGRLFIDFLVEADGHPFLSPYLQAAGSNFSHGASFAAAGSGVLRKSTGSSPFSLWVQVLQFRAFRRRIREVQNKTHFYGKAHLLPKLSNLRRSLFYISVMGNDYTNAYLGGMGMEQVKKETVPEVVKGMMKAVEALYGEGGRYFVLANMPPQGCLPSYLTMFPFIGEDLDSAGCLVNYNQVDELHNNLLRKAIHTLRSKLKNATLVYMDSYTIMTNALGNPSHYGFTHTTTACCGSSGGPYNYDPALACGDSLHVEGGRSFRAEPCPDPQHYVQWDGTHQTEAYHRYAIKAALSGKHLVPHLPLQHNCKLHLNRL